MIWVPESTICAPKSKSSAAKSMIWMPKDLGAYMYDLGTQI